MTPKINGIHITNPNKILYPTKNISKFDVANYYSMVSNRMLPFLKQRPLAVIRAHSNNFNEVFFKKHPEENTPHIQTFLEKSRQYFYITTKKGIVYQSQLGTLEFHTQGCKATKLKNPDIMVFDLDPADNVSLQKLREGVYDLKFILDNLNLTSFIKTSGGKGYHIVVPFVPCKSWHAFNLFSKQVALLMEAKWPQKYTTNIRKKERDGKIFIDYLRNDKGSTCVAPYSLRARKDAPVSMPICWSELNKVTPNEITLCEALKKINEPDPWQDFFKIKQKIK